MTNLRLTSLMVFVRLLVISNAQFAEFMDPDPDIIVGPEVLAEKWTLMESNMKSSFEYAMKMVLTNAIGAANSVNISFPCIQDVFKVVTGIKKMKVWAFKFLDASSKSIDGLMALTLASLGNFEECINNEVIDQRSGKQKGKILFRGKYCTVHVKMYLPPRPKKIHWDQTLDALRNFTNKDTIIGHIARMAHLSYYGSQKFAVCVPSTCSENDVNQMLKRASDSMGVIMKAPRCEVKEENSFTPAIIGIIALYSITGLLVLIGTVLDVYCWYGNKTFRSTGIHILKTLSVVTSFQKIMDTSTAPETSRCLNGMKFLSIAWIILGHSNLFMTFVLHKIPHTYDLYVGIADTPIVMGILAVDTFFYIAGLLLCYNFTKLVIIGKKPFSLIMYIFHRIWRIFPSYAFVIAFFFLMPLMGSGPEFHPTIGSAVQSCQQNWWASLLFINNFYDTANMCCPEGWYLAADMQLYIAALIILFPLKKSSKLGIVIAVICITSSMVGTWLSTYINNFDPVNNFTLDIRMGKEMFRYYYIMPHVHAGPYCVGILCGYLLAVRPKFKMSKALQILGWGLSTICCLSVIYGPWKWNELIEPTFLEALFYSSCSRVAFSLSIAWVTMCCWTGHGGIVNNILSWKLWIPLGRLSLLAYLIHPTLMRLYIGTVRTEVITDHHTGVWLFLGHLVLAYLFALAGNLLVEGPFASLEKVLLFKEEKKELTNNQLGNCQVEIDSTVSEKNVMPYVLSEKEEVEENNKVNNITFVSKI